MARLSRLVLPGLPHHVIQRGHNRQAIFLDDADRQAYLAALQDVAASLRVAVHAYVLMAEHVHLLLTPPDEAALGLLMQGLGRRYVAAFNRRHGRSGTIWEGRYRATVIEPEPYTLPCMRYIEQNPVRAGLCLHAADWPWSSAAHHVGRRRDALISEPMPFWAQGNTPFEREMAWQRLLDEPLPDVQVQQMTDSALKGWVLGSGPFLARVGTSTGRPVAPRPRGRPRHAPTRDGGAA
ncbi:putative transposase [Sphaerotilus hippei]|uniref:Putative transposase n=1 Tax=Sphaerotilus hippei TaxID=744406 RepID=A0A318HCY1_9BURK|nr:transposase [Sphaerotilus hippei]PXW97131.1 putative transposase [Sphaerotilus hippei]